MNLSSFLNLTVDESERFTFMQQTSAKAGENPKDNLIGELFAILDEHMPEVDADALIDDFDDIDQRRRASQYLL